MLYPEPGFTRTLTPARHGDLGALPTMAHMLAVCIRYITHKYRASWFHSFVVCCCPYSVCDHGLAIHSASASPCPLGREAGCHSQWNAGSPVAPSPGRRMPNPVHGTRQYALGFLQFETDRSLPIPVYEIFPLCACLYILSVFSFLSTGKRRA